MKINVVQHQNLIDLIGIGTETKFLRSPMHVVNLHDPVQSSFIDTAIVHQVLNITVRGVDLTDQDQHVVNIGNTDQTLVMTVKAGIWIWDNAIDQSMPFSHAIFGSSFKERLEVQTRRRVILTTSRHDQKKRRCQQTRKIDADADD